MTDDETIRAIHATAWRLSLAVTGGASEAISGLLRVPGASQTVLSARVPYAEAALCEYLGRRPESFCSSATARAMAMAAYCEAQRLADGQQPLAGFGATCSLASDRPKRGPHRIHLAAQTATSTETWSLELIKGVRSRAEEEALAGALLLSLIASTTGVAPQKPTLREGESVATQRTIACHEWQQLLAERIDAVWQRAGFRGAVIGSYVQPKEPPQAPPPPRALLCGAFHPLHDGHREMADKAARQLGAPVAFEITTHNVDKLPLDFTDMGERLSQFDADTTVWFTRVGTFVGKARLFPGVTFVTGVDTIERIGEERYYPPGGRDAALSELAALGCRFLVFGRSGPDGFRELADLALPPALAALATGVSESAFRRDISSTELREHERNETG